MHCRANGAIESSDELLEADNGMVYAFAYTSSL
jgi:hypothetical protein